MINHLRKLYSSRELLFNLVKRELKVKYKRSIFGFLWSFLNPLVIAVVYAVIVGKVMGMDKIVEPGYNDVKNFAAYLLTGLLAWNYLSNSLSMATGSLVDSGSLVRKIYFPREIIPFSTVLANLVNFGFELIILFIFLSIIGIYFYIQIPILILVIFIETLFILGLSALFSLSNVYFRDTKHLISVFLLIWFWTCPIVYPFTIIIDKSSAIGSWVVTLYKLNPMASIIMMYQEVLYKGKTPSLKILGIGLIFSVLFFLASLAIFKMKEEDIASEV